MKKKYLLLSIIMVCAFAFYFLTPSFETIVKQLVHKYGSEITGTDVRLSGFDLKLTNGEGHIGKITVGNPQNYKLEHAIELDGISIKVDIKSLTKDIIIIKSIEVNAPHIYYEMLSVTQNNLKQLLDNIEKNTQTASSKSQDTSKTPAQSDKSTKNKSEKKVIIKKLIIRNGEISVAASVAADATKTTVSLPTITLNNIGEEKKGTSIAETISKILKKIISTSYTTILESKLTDIKNVTAENLNNVVGGVKNRIKEIGIFGK